MKSYRLILALLVVFVLGNTANAITYYSRQTGAWNQATTWSTVACGGVAAGATPAAGDIAFVCGTHTVSVTANVTTQDVTINSTGYLRTGTTGGGANRTVTITGTFTILAGGVYNHNNNQLASTTIFAGTEVFSPTSTILITIWSGDTDRLITGVGSNFGHLTLTWNSGAFIWQNDGLGYTRTIQGNFTVSAGTSTILDQSAANITIPIGGNMTVAGILRMKYNVGGSLTVTVVGTTTVSGSLFGIYIGNGAFNFTTGNYTQSAGTHWGIYAGDGNANYTCAGTFTVSGGDCRGINNTSTFTAGVANYTIGTFSFTGGTFLGSYACHVGGQASTFNVSGNMTVTYGATSNLCAINRLASLNVTPTTTGLNLTVGGNLTFGGVLGEFNSNNGTGVETDIITGNMAASNGNNFFNSVLTAGNGHTTTMTVGGTFAISGGNTRLSSENGTLTCTVAGAATISGGSCAVKEGTGNATVNFNSTYSQTGGTFGLHRSGTIPTTSVVTVNVAGNFSHTGGIINYDDNAASTGIHRVNLFGATSTMGGAGSITHASAGTGTVFGEFHYARTGTIAWSRTSTTHAIQQVKQFVDAVCTVDASASANPMQVASNVTLANISLTALTVNGILNMGAQTITAVGPSLAGYYSGMTVNGRLRTSHTSGFYNGTTTATLQPQTFAIDVVYRMDFSLGATSTVEYYGTANQAVTGKYPLAGAVVDVSATAAVQYHYGNLDINNTGAGTYAFPHTPILGTGNVFVRTSLVLTAGEYNLAGSGAGLTTTIENSAATGITRDGVSTLGYIKSEEANGGNNRAKIRWNMGTATGAHVIPFGTASGAANFIPFTFNKTTGGGADVLVSTRGTAGSANTPWAAASNVGAVAHMFDPTLGQDGSDEAVVDRWWDINTTAAATATVTFSYRGAENTMIVPYNTGTLGAQHWDGTAWEPPVGSAAAVTAGVGSITVAGLNTFSPWVLASLAAPLPVELVSFTATCSEGHAVIDWSTASETMNDYFVVEKSEDGEHYIECGRSDGAGTSTEMHNYKLIDPTALNGLTYYRVRQVDFNGEATVTKVISVNSCESNGTTINSWHSSGAVNIQILGEQEGTYSTELVDMQGRTVLQSSTTKESDLATGRLNTEGLQQGIYLLKTTDPNGVVTCNRICLCGE